MLKRYSGSAVKWFFYIVFTIPCLHFLPNIPGTKLKLCLWENLNRKQSVIPQYIVPNIKLNCATTICYFISCILNSTYASKCIFAYKLDISLKLSKEHFKWQTLGLQIVILNHMEKETALWSKLPGNHSVLIGFGQVTFHGFNKHLYIHNQIHHDW